MTQATTHDTQRKRFRPEQAHRWWESLRPDPESRRPGDPAALAALRRCATTSQVHLVPVFELLVREMPEARLDDLAVVAAVLAHVREHDPSAGVAEQIAKASGPGGQPAVSPLRFRRLLQVNGAEERIRAGARIARQLKGQVNVVDLADALYWWDHEQDLHRQNMDVQRRWARRYYATLPSEHFKKSA